MAGPGRSDNDAKVTELIQTIDLDLYQHGTSEERDKECRKAAASLHTTGCLFVKDPRVKDEDNQTFLDLLERYFASSDGIRDARPELSYQVGVTPAMIEKPRNHCSKIANLPEFNKPLTICPPEVDPKWRFFWRINQDPLPVKSRFPQLNNAAVVPPDFPEWTETMNMWGYKMLETVKEVAHMLAHGFDLPIDAFTSRMQYGPHLLAPTGSNFSKHGKVGTVLAGYHYDLNFLTIHGKSRFPGLYIWLRSGKKILVRIPDGCLLVQAGKQIEYLTGGYVLAGFHEVVVAPETEAVIAQRKKQGRSPWRVSSTLFSHIASDQQLKPLGHFATPEAQEAFPPIDTGDQVMQELNAIKLGAEHTINGSR